MLTEERSYSDDADNGIKCKMLSTVNFSVQSLYSETCAKRIRILKKYRKRGYD